MFSRAPRPAPGSGRMKPETVPPGAAGLRRALFCGLLLAHSALAMGGDPAAGRQAAAACRVCHGMDGKSVRPDAPNIGGQLESYLRQQLLDYRSGKRQHPVMSVVAEGLSDADIDNLAAYYAGIRASVESSP